MVTTVEFGTKWLSILITTLYVGMSVCINPPLQISNWIPISAYTNPEVTYTHGLGEVPIKVDVQVRVTDTSRNKYVIFNAISSGHRGDDDSSEFGGVIYVYNDNEVKMIAPGSSSGTGNGKLVHLGGSKYVGPTITGDFSSGHVRVRLWKQCNFAKPTFVSASVTLNNSESYSYQEVFHSVGRIPDLVIVQVFLDNDWVTDAQGISFYSKSSNTFGGVVFALGSDSVRIWTPTKGSGSPSNGVVFNAVDGWGNGGQFMYDNAATVKVWAWNFGDLLSDPTKILTYLRNLPSDGTASQSVSIKDDGFLTVKVQVETDANSGYGFYAAGTAPTTDGLGASVYYAGLVYGVMNDTIMMWHPDDSETQGCLAMVYDQWGNGNEKQCVKEYGCQIVVQVSYADVNEPPCGERDCNPSDIGPTCVCNGTGFEGQYCGSMVQCTGPTTHRNANYSPLQSLYNFESTVTFNCRNGYEYDSGNQTATCNAYKVWEGAPYLCNPKSCGSPDNGINSTMVVEGVYFSNTVTYVCADGYDIESGDEVRICQANQQWSGQAPVCERSCGDPNENGATVVRTNQGLTIGANATFECITGYEPESGNFTRDCLTDATWSGIAPVCKRVLCGAPQDPTGTNSTLSYNSTEYESIATYTCVEGYHIGNRSSFHTTCQASRNWTSMKFCEKVICPFFSIGVKAVITSHQGIEYGNIIEYKCQYGTILSSGTLQRTCQSNTSWSGTAPVCEDIVCPDPGEVANGTVVHLNTAYNGMVVIWCNQGYAVEYGDPARTCGDGGQWSGIKPFCGEVYQVFLNPVNGTPPYLPFLGIGSSSNNNPSITTEDILLLRIPFKSTNRYLRTLYSAPDDRWESKFIGIIGVSLVSIPIIFTLAIDMMDYVMRNSATPGSSNGGGGGSGNGNGGNANSGQIARNSNKKPPKVNNKKDNEVVSDISC